MGKRKDKRERVSQRQIGFRNRQIDFFDEYRDLNIQEVCRKAIDKQIEMIDSSFLEEK